MASPLSTSTTLTEDQHAELLHNAFGGKLDLHSDIVHDKFQEAMGSKDVQSATSQAIQTLNTTVRDVRQAFRHIREDLEQFDGKQFRGKDDTVLQLSPGWDELHEQFRNMLDASRDNATDAAVFMREFATTILGNADDPEMWSSIQEELARLKQIVHEKEEKARSATHGFDALAESVRVFGTKIDVVLKDVESHIQKEINETQDRIDYLHNRLQEISRDVKDVAHICVGYFATTALGVGMAVVTLAPEAFFLAAASALALGNSGYQFFKLLDQRKNARTELKQCNQKMAELRKSQDEFYCYKESLESTQSDIKELWTKINTFVSIWQSLQTDLHRFEEQLNYAAGTDAKINKLFPKKIANMRGLYTTLISLLDAYAKESVDQGECM